MWDETPHRNMSRAEYEQAAEKFHAAMRERLESKKTYEIVDADEENDESGSQSS